MKILILLLSSLSFIVMANDVGQQAMTRTELSEDPNITFQNNTRSSSSVVSTNNRYCQEFQQVRSRMAELEFRSPEFNSLIERANELSDLCYINIQTSGDQVVGISFENDTQNPTNPAHTDEVRSTRSYRFEFPERSKQNVSLTITENAGLTRLMSHDLLESTIIFLPRKVIPYVEITPGCNPDVRRIHIPTDEIIELNAHTNEIIAGVLEESPMDMNTSRHRRNFAGLNYTGNGIMIRADRRAGTPEHNYSRSFNRNERVREATVTHKGKTCHVPKELIWHGASEPDSTPYFRYTTDQEFLDQVANGHCHWNLTMEDIE